MPVAKAALETGCMCVQFRQIHDDLIVVLDTPKGRYYAEYDLEEAEKMLASLTKAVTWMQAAKQGRVEYLWQGRKEAS